MELREELRRLILAKLREKSDPLDGFYAAEDVKEAILAVMISGRHLLLEGPPGTGKTTLAKILASHLPPMQVVTNCRYNCEPESPQCPDCLPSYLDIFISGSFEYTSYCFFCPYFCKRANSGPPNLRHRIF